MKIITTSLFLVAFLFHGLSSEAAPAKPTSKPAKAKAKTQPPTKQVKAKIKLGIDMLQKNECKKFIHSFLIKAEFKAKKMKLDDRFINGFCNRGRKKIIRLYTQLLKMKPVKVGPKTVVFQVGRGKATFRLIKKEWRMSGKR